MGVLSLLRALRAAPVVPMTSFQGPMFGQLDICDDPGRLFFLKGQRPNVIAP